MFYPLKITLLRACHTWNTNALQSNRGASCLTPSDLHCVATHQILSVHTLLSTLLYLALWISSFHTSLIILQPKNKCCSISLPLWHMMYLHSSITPHWYNMSSAFNPPFTAIHRIYECFGILFLNQTTICHSTSGTTCWILLYVFFIE